MNTTTPCPEGTRRLPRLLFLLLTVVALAGCGGGSGGTPTPPPVQDSSPPVEDPVGVAIIGLTDAPGDFLNYSVAVVSIVLTRANGVQVETLPESMTVDFAQYVEATEFVTAATVPTGVYTEMSLVLDYGAARVLVEGDDGNGIEVQVLDESGNPVGQTQLTVEFGERDRFVIAPGVPAHVTLDFDLDASHKVDLDAATATLAGVLYADALLENPKPRRARGLLVDVDVDAGRFEIALRPFFRPGGNFGPLTVFVDEDTTFEIDEIGYGSEDGLAALADKPRGTSVVALGELERDPRRFVAETVLAGSSVPYGEKDIAHGSVIARDGDRLTLRGVTLIRENMSVVFNDTLTLLIGPQTRVTQQGASLIELGGDDISIGQRVTAVGTLGEDGTLDAGDGLVRIRYSDLAGVTLQVAPLVMDLSTVNRRRVRLFNFDGTGAAASSNADPDNYEIETGNLTLNGVGLGAPTKVRGLVAPFGTAPMDFYAKTIADVSILPARLTLGWQAPGDPEAFSQIDPAGIVVNLREDLLAERHHFVVGDVPLDLLANGTTLSLLPSDTGRGVFAIRQNRRQQMFFDFAGFSEELASRLDGSVAARRISGGGVRGEGNDFTPRRLLIILD